jgi:hypothetical protein
MTTKIVREAKICCPHCGKPVTVRDTGGVSPANAKRIMAHADKMIEDMAKHFDRIFHPALWK